MRTRALILVFAILAIALPAVAQDKAKRIDGFVQQFVKANQFGGQIVAAENGKVIYDKAFGLANADFKISNQPNTRIGIASITKLMTAVILDRLVADKKLAMGDKLSRYIRDFPASDKITIEMLARHRSGIPHRVMAPEKEALSYTSSEFVEEVKKAKLAFEPGAQYLYSSAGYAVLARCLEIASGKSYAQLIQEYVFSPAGMSDSVHFNGESIMERRALDYYPAPDGMINVPLKDYSFLVGAGSIYSTARDVYKFGEAVIEGKFGDVSRSSLIRDGVLAGSGSTNGHRSQFEMTADKKYGVVIVANMSGAFDTVLQGLREILQGKELTAKFTPTPRIVPELNKELGQFTGHYKRTDGVEVDVVNRNDALYAGDIRLYPIKADCFFEYRFFGEACFKRAADGKVNEITWKGVGFDLRWVKQ
jgi:CubicO group peptidase (beta-lactamase class C family)